VGGRTFWDGCMGWKRGGLPDRTKAVANNGRTKTTTPRGVFSSAFGVGHACMGQQAARNPEVSAGVIPCASFNTQQLHASTD